MLCAIKQNLFLCFALIHNVTLRVMGFQSKTPTLCGQERLCQTSLLNAKRARLAAFDKIGNVFLSTYSQMIAQQFRQLIVYCRHLYFMKTGHEINCCVFKSRECMLLASFEQMSFIVGKQVFGISDQVRHKPAV